MWPICQATFPPLKVKTFKQTNFAQTSTDIFQKAGKNTVLFSNIQQ